MGESSRVLYTARTHTTGGRDNGLSRSSDGRLDVQLSAPGSPRIGTNPEQLFAAGWSACLVSAIGLAARERGLSLPGDLTIDADVALNHSEEGYFLSARFVIKIPGVDRASAQSLVDDAHASCPYSKATRGNLSVSISLA